MLPLKSSRKKCALDNNLWTQEQKTEMIRLMTRYQLDWYQFEDVRPTGSTLKIMVILALIGYFEVVMLGRNIIFIIFYFCALKKCSFFCLLIIQKGKCCFLGGIFSLLIIKCKHIDCHKNTGFGSFTGKKKHLESLYQSNQEATHKRRKHSVNALSEYVHKCVSV